MSVGGYYLYHGQLQVSRRRLLNGNRARFFISLLMVGAISLLLIEEPVGNFICQGAFWFTVIFGTIFADYKSEPRQDPFEKISRLLVFAIASYFVLIIAISAYYYWS